MTEYYAPVDPDALRRERERARELRASQWWKRRISEGVCHYCHQRVGPRALTMDHIVPLGRGGRSARGNVVAACKPCNTKKQSLLPVEWAEYLQRLDAREDSNAGPPSGGMGGPFEAPHPKSREDSNPG